MGNRAIIRAAGTHKGVYLHWNGGRDSVEPFLEYCKLKGYRSFEDGYGTARFCQVVGNWFGGSLCIGIETDVYDRDADGLDNGIFDVEGWDIVRRVPSYAREQRRYDHLEMLLSIDAAQPVKEQLGERFLTAQIVPTADIKIGDRVFVRRYGGAYEEAEVIGIGSDMVVNGQNVLGIPYVGIYGDEPVMNPNNYLRNEEYRVVDKPV